MQAQLSAAPLTMPSDVLTAEQLAKAYQSLYPSEVPPGSEADTQRIMGNWLDRLNLDPSAAISRSNWYGKVTKALFSALEIRQPINKADMLAALVAEVAARSSCGNRVDSTTSPAGKAPVRSCKP